MSIEASNKTVADSWRVNPFAPTEVDWRKNQHGARWKFYRRYATAEEARQEVIRLSKGEAKSADQ